MSRRTQHDDARLGSLWDFFFWLAGPRGARAAALTMSSFSGFFGSRTNASQNVDEKAKKGLNKKFYKAQRERDFHIPFRYLHMDLSRKIGYVAQSIRPHLHGGSCMRWAVVQARAVLLCCRFGASGQVRCRSCLAVCLCW